MPGKINARRRHRHARRADPCSALLRGAGLNVTSARLAAVRLAPHVLSAHGQLTPQHLHAAARDAGYAISASAWYRVLACLQSAGLLPDAAQAHAMTQTHTPALRSDPLDDDHAR
jgi:Fe2+ or Zn2+ uptake regulation protein